MGAKIAKQKPPSSSHAVKEIKSDADLAMDALNKSACNFLAEVRLGNGGYKLINNTPTDEETRIMVKTRDNVTPDDIDHAIGSIFTGDWPRLSLPVFKIMARDIIIFLTGVSNKPYVNAEFSKSYLAWEFNSLVQYSIYMKETSAKTLLTGTQGTETTLLACICRGIVDYTVIDPLIVLHELNLTLLHLPDDELMKVFDENMRDIFEGLGRPKSTGN